MMPAKYQIALCFALAVPVGCGSSESAPPRLLEDPQNSFEQLVASYIDFYSSVFPTWATDAGEHRFDDRLFKYDLVSIQKTVAAFRGYHELLRSLPREGISSEAKIDCDILENHIKCQIFILEDVREWSRNPLIYASELLFGLEQLAIGRFSTLEVRIEQLIRRQAQIPDLLDAAQTNLTAASPTLAREAVNLLASSLILIDETLPAIADELENAALLGEFRSTQESASLAIQAFLNELERRIPRLTKEPRLGRESLAKWLKLSEMVETPIETLHSRAEVELEQCRSRIEEAVLAIDESVSVSDYLASLTEDHGTTSSLLDDASEILERLVTESSKIVSGVDSSALEVGPLPPYLYGLTRMTISGPRENPPYGTFSIALPQDEWEPEQAEEHLKSLNRPTLALICIHETIPGRFHQSLSQARSVSKVRARLPSYSFVEGWCHYVEKVLVETRLKGDHPSWHIVQMRDEALRLCRVLASIRFHTEDASLEDIAELFVDKGYQTQEYAFQEAIRSIHDPLYLSYALGRMMIEELFVDWKKARSKESLIEFHDEVLSHGAPPIPALRRLLKIPQGDNNL